MTPNPLTVTTHKATYNIVIDREHFQRLRNTFQDFTAILEAWYWDTFSQKYIEKTAEAIQAKW